MTCDICNKEITAGKEAVIDSLNVCPMCHGDIFILGYYFPEVDDLYGVKPQQKKLTHTKVKTSNKSKEKPITESDINIVKWELNNKDVWKELEGGS